MVPSVSRLPGESVFNIVTESRHCLQMSLGSVEVLKAEGHHPMGLRLGQGNSLWERRVASPVWFLWKFMGAQGVFPAGKCWELSLVFTSFETLATFCAGEFDSQRNSHLCVQPTPQFGCRQGLVLCGPLLGTTGFSDGLTAGYLSAPQLRSSYAGFLR